MDCKNLNQVLLKNFIEYAHKPALMWKTGGRYRELTYRHLGDTCKAVARALRETGFETGDRAVILSNSRPEWAFADLGALLAGGLTSAIYEEIETQQPACIIYTSGTTGAPKGVVLTHGNYLKTMESVVRHISSHDKLQLHFSFLPLAHSFERLAGHYLIFYMGRCVAYTESMETIAENMREVRPNIITAVPRFFEKIYVRIMQGISTAPRVKRMMFRWAVALGREWNDAKENQRSLSVAKVLQYSLADRLVFRKIRKAFGGRLEFCISGGAPLSPQIARFFYDLGILILEGWGATEATAPTTINKPDEFRFGSVGKPIPGVHIRVAGDGELEVKGPNIFKEYWKRFEDTQEGFTPDGYYRTGDIGVIDSNGWVFITDRKKQIIVTAGGKNVAPAAIEQVLNNQLHIEMSYIHGDRRKYLTALLALDETVLDSTVQKLNLQNLSREDLREHPQIIQIVQEEVDQANAQLPRYMQIKRFCILPELFSVEKGELTHTQKLRKKIIEEKYRNLLDSMYPAEA
jgi:long-chain acyl-CoA synthetase